ncbi:hypothetical protein H072_8782 [Dactylellina haptotyla CBS 200.50]|uniref:Cyanovirin-N domain-containing protein n=1 Tax=Dactylellina haptotyla (strain CBS 200.50) TaxID=1284197 RepID=S8A410_DACHA|nr:hypothetical protein H072_8782 [Dactylellina haptotyla CBS 200.50]
MTRLNYFISLAITFTTALAGNYDGDWDNSGLSGSDPNLYWPLYMDTKDYAKTTGFYQLDCSDARSGGKKSGNKDLEKWNHPQADLQLDACERECRCNAWGEFLISPIEVGLCSDQSFLQLCVIGAGCKCTWVQQGHVSGDDGVKTDVFRTDQADTMPAPQGDTPPAPKHDELKRRD